MATCFIFLNELDDEHFLSLKLDREGALLSSLGFRTALEINTLQKNAKTLIVLPGVRAGIHEVALAQVSERKARVALPYAIEDKIAQPVQNVHVAFDKKLYHRQKYLIAVLDQNYFQSVINKLHDEKITYDAITSCWFALSEGDVCITEHELLVNLDAFKGALNPSLAEQYLSCQNQSAVHLTCFSDSPGLKKFKNIYSIDELSYQWVAKQLLKKPYINFCQGAFKPLKKDEKPFIWYQLSAVVLMTWIISIIAFDVAKLIVLNQKMAAVDAKIKVIYHHFFPEATKVISPKFRIEQALKNGRYDKSDVFWRIISRFGQSYAPELVSIKQIRMQNNRLSVDVVSPDFTKLEKYERQLKNNQLVVEQSQASLKDNHVIATLEIR